MIKKIIILLLMVSFACTGCRSGIADDVANEGNIITDQDESDAGINQANPFMDRNRGNMPVVEIDEVYEALTEAVVDNPEIVGELDEEEKQGMANGMAGQILAMLNQSADLSLVGGDIPVCQ